ncbi:AMP-binding protein [Corallococcus macrosporus]|uniref:AMP-binding protein n=1 Tax=Corallococcus macrosporus TaxID=35 RepID=A0ABS3DMM2_9BACT|nr:condensation domain-containing protein [Corallococcus macrosporus]MBN8232592.1 AMP-binding protein [Corallococcus macrosporus]
MNLLDILTDRVETAPHATAFTFLDSGEDEAGRLTNAEVLRRSREIGGLLREAGARGERVLLLFPPGLDYVAAFLGCLQAGAVAVPAYPPDPMRLARTLPRLEALTADAQVRFVLAPAFIRDMAQELFGQADMLARATWLALEDVTPGHADAWRDPGVSGDTVAFLQYTSGSTGAPRGVVLTHDNLLHNSAAIQRCFQHGPDSVGVIWLPPYHDMGLIGGILQPLYVGFPVVLMSPLDFLARPLRWLEAVSRYRATTSGGPNFAFELCARKATAEQVAELDLSSWRLAFNGAEPLNPATLERFQRTFAPAGFRPEAMYPCYGLAEATLIASGKATAVPVVRAFEKEALADGEARPAPEAPPLVGCGASLPDQELLIVDPATRQPLADGRVGEIWLRGPSVARGYWNRPEETAESFAARRADAAAAGPYLRTGDLGFLHGGELFVSGRLKDLIIVRGRKHHPHDLERTAVASHPALRPGCSAAFSAQAPEGERLVLVQEVDPRKAFEAEACARRVREAVTREHGIQLDEVVFIAPGSLPKTSSGKVQRRATRDAWRSDELQVLARDARAAQEAATESGPLPALDALRALEPAEREARVEAWLRSRAAAALRIPAARMDAEAPLVQLGLDSLSSVELRADIEQALGLSIPLPELLGGLSFAELTRRCRRSLDVAPVAASRPQPVGREGVLPLSFAQEEMWLASRLDSSGGGYLIPVALELKGALQVVWLEEALREILQRHEALRTCFPEVDGRPVQHVLPAAALPLPVEDLRGLAPEAREARVREAALAEARAPFALQQGPLLRARLLQVEDARHVLLFTVHHLVADGWSMRLLVQELAALYAARQAGTAPELPALPYQYADFAVWQRQRLTGEHLESLLGWWRGEVAGLTDTPRLPTDHDPATPPDGLGGSLDTLLAPELAARLREGCAKHGVTPFMWMLTVFQLLLARGTGQEDGAVGVADLGRGAPGCERLIGNFINMLVLRLPLGGDPPFQDLLRRVRERALGAAAHAELPYEQLARGRAPLFRAAFGTQNQPRERILLPGLEVQPLAFDTGLSRLDLTLWVSETPEGLRCHWTYATRLFERASVERLHRRFVEWLDATLARPEARPSSLGGAAPGDTGMRGALDRLGPRRRRDPGSDGGAPPPNASGRQTP